MDDRPERTEELQQALARSRTTQRRLEVELQASRRELARVRDSLASVPHAAATVLVVDDDPVVLAAVSAALRGLGFRVREAEDAEVALATMNIERCGIVLTDIILPTMSGVELARQIERRHPRAKVIYMTGGTMRPAEDKPVLRKPVSANMLAAVLPPPSSRPRPG
jgi:CheY-like chemotaxis protein